MSDLISRHAAIDAVLELDVTNRVSWKDAVIDTIDALPSAEPEIVRCGECVYRRSCMLQHFAESNAVDGTKIDWSDWYCAEGVRDISKSDERLEE